MMKNGIYFRLTAFLVAELFNILIYANEILSPSCGVTTHLICINQNLG